MSKKKKLFLSVAVVTLLFGAVACGDDDSDQTASSSEASSSGASSSEASRSEASYITLIEIADGKATILLK